MTKLDKRTKSEQKLNNFLSMCFINPDRDMMAMVENITTSVKINYQIRKIFYSTNERGRNHYPDDE